MRSLLDTIETTDSQPDAAGKKRGPYKWKRRRVGAYASVGAFREIDGRTKAALFLKRTRDDLTAHVGGSPSATQRLLIERCTILLLRCHQLDERILAGEILTDANNDKYIAYQNAARRCLVSLGLEKPEQPQPSLMDILGREVA